MSNIAPSTATKPPRKFYFDPKWIIILGIVLALAAVFIGFKDQIIAKVKELIDTNLNAIG